MEVLELIFCFLDATPGMGDVIGRMVLNQMGESVGQNSGWWNGRMLV
jgi:hypothetical protein